MHPLERLYPQLVDGDTPASLADLTPGATILDPVAGAMADPILYSFLAARHMWLAAHEARVETVRSLHGAGRSIVEQILHLTLDGKPVSLPVATVADVGDDGKLERVRIYHATVPVRGRHEFRGPLLPADPALRAAEPVTSYFWALAAGRVADLVALFVDVGTVREAHGLEAHAGTEALRAHFGTLLAGGGMSVELCSVTDEGAACAVEYNVLRLGETRLVPQPALAVFERATPTALTAVRLYDEVDPEVVVGLVDVMGSAG